MCHIVPNVYMLITRISGVATGASHTGECNETIAIDIECRCVGLGEIDWTYPCGCFMLLAGAIIVVFTLNQQQGCHATILWESEKKCFSLKCRDESHNIPHITYVVMY